MPTYTQESRLLELTTPLGPDTLLLKGFTGTEAISQPFNFHIELLAEQTAKIAFQDLLGQKVTVRLSVPTEHKRYFNGIINRISQGARSQRFIRYQAEIVPQFWLLTKAVRSRIFQHISVPDLLKKVLAGLNIAYDLRGTFEPRDYCVQFRESDFHFASRLMEEEGIYYFFKHTADEHTLVLANTPASHADLPGNSHIIYEEVSGGTRDEERITGWRKLQQLRSGKFTVWDHCFELPHNHLEAQQIIQDTVQTGTVTHHLKVGGNDNLEIYRYPGEYAQRFDGIEKGGSEQPTELQKIFQDNVRTVKIRMQQEALPSLLIHGSSSCRQLTTGYKFTLTRHFSGNGPYVLTSVNHFARESYETGEGEESTHYSNAFTCIPSALAFTPPRSIPKPIMAGTQPAVVVGPAGEEIFTDKYGRVKVHFMWDREGNADADSSCWVRVSTVWAGKSWGAIHIPRIGQEVVVSFVEGDPDQPIIIGSVYNAEQMPPYPLPAQKTKSCIKSNSSLGGSGFNEIRFEDKKGEEQVFIHGEKNLDIRIKNDRKEWIGQDRHLIVKRDKVEKVERDSHADIGRDLVERFSRDHDITVSGKQATQVQGSRSLVVQGDIIDQFSGNQTTQVTSNSYQKAMNVILEGVTALTIKVGSSFIAIGPASVQMVGPIVTINSGGTPLSGVPGNAVSPITPTAAAPADDAESGSSSASGS